MSRMVRIERRITGGRPTRAATRLVIPIDNPSGSVMLACLLSWPVTTALAPGGWHTLVQPWEGRRYTTRISARGRVRPARLTKCRIDDAVFPDFSSQRVLSCLQVTSFSMVFPPAIVEDAA